MFRRSRGMQVCHEYVDENITNLYNVGVYGRDLGDTSDVASVPLPNGTGKGDDNVDVVLLQTE